ncbi:hypothetical protein TIFTF001_009080 [Ficus carica]|uniref:UDP-glycosyltransferases domain-containing protein n=1 Tax=Ficus carica TaxID=3494 RepID=A0AA87ZP90_FICCA|nr:hypothetical protein TIFTF001_009080 [Ficus carica]
MATKHLQKPFEQLLQRLKESQNLPLCVISDFFLGFTLKVCEGFGIPRLVFHGMGAFPIAIIKAYMVHKPQLTANSFSDPVEVPGIKLPFVLTVSDLPDYGLNIYNSSDFVNDPISRFFEEINEADVNSWGVVVNTFVDLEMGHVSSLESFYREGARAWCVGPLNLYNDVNYVQNEPFDSVMKWLDDQAQSRFGSVIYVSFGTQADVSNAQLDEVAYGMEESGESFIWVVRSNTWTLPNDINERTNDKSLIVSSWVDQQRILSHSLVGGFLSHCGWNSILESISAGVPILAWPMIAEQMLNAEVVVEGLGAGIRIREASDMGSGNNVVSREEIF